jgi:hypothetical protein
MHELDGRRYPRFEFGDVGSLSPNVCGARPASSAQPTTA